jgi:hypothetical protein
MITNIQSNITAYGLFVGSIVQDTEFAAAGKAASISPTLGLYVFLSSFSAFPPGDCSLSSLLEVMPDALFLDSNLNLFPPDIFSLLRALVVDAGLPTEQLDGIVALGGYTYTPSTGAGSRLAKRDLLGDATFGGLLDDAALFGGDMDLSFGKRELEKRNLYTG